MRTSLPGEVCSRQLGPELRATFARTGGGGGWGWDTGVTSQGSGFCSACLVVLVISFISFIDSQCFKMGRFHMTSPYPLLFSKLWENRQLWVQTPRVLATLGWPGQQPPSLVTAHGSHLVSSQQLALPTFTTRFVPWRSPVWPRPLPPVFIPVSLTRTPGPPFPASGCPGWGPKQRDPATLSRGGEHPHPHHPNLPPGSCLPVTGPPCLDGTSPFPAPGTGRGGYLTQSPQTTD